MQCPWGQKAFAGYLGENREKWRAYDASELVLESKFHSPILIDVGTSDRFRQEQLKPEIFEQACAKVGQPLMLRQREGYDHSYYFITTFIEEHIRYHAQALL
jgi:S-formylglutathione hydrolase